MTTADTRSVVSVQDILHRAVAAHREGKTAEALAFYRTILALDPINPDALHLAGVALRGLGAPERAAQWIFRALMAQADLSGANANLHNALSDIVMRGDDFYKMGDWTGAIACYDAVLRFAPTDYLLRAVRDAVNARRGGKAEYRAPDNCQIPDLPRIFRRIFGDRQNGVFVEVGAFDGESHSNTAGLADMGWRGVYIEPVPQYAALCAARHRLNHRVQIVQCAVGAERGEATLLLAGTLSTLSAAQAAVYRRLPWAQGAMSAASIQTPLRRLDDVLNEVGIAPGFDLLVVDVEGAEDEVFAGFPLDDWRPRVMIVELNDTHPDFQDAPEVVARCAALRRRIAEHGYQTLYADTINTVFVRCDATEAAAC